MERRNKDKDYNSGQSALEYTLLLGTIIAVIIVVLFGTSDSTNPNGLKAKIQSAYETAGTAVQYTIDDAKKAGIFRAPAGGGGGGQTYDQDPQTHD